MENKDLAQEVTMDSQKKRRRKGRTLDACVKSEGQCLSTLLLGIGKKYLYLRLCGVGSEEEEKR